MDGQARAVASAFRDAMRRFASTVSIVTVWSNGERHGTTATAVTSVSMDPPSMLVCINRDSRLHNHLVAGERFCVNLLHVDNLQTSRLFASPLSSADRFACGDWRMDAASAPYLADAQANVFCIKDKMVEYGSHTIFIGRVVDVRMRSDVAPLLYQNGCYAADAAVLPEPGGKMPAGARRSRTEPLEETS
ncbi:MAG TPA: flavin reductase family protein [Hyphomicrobiaceae bacterium]|nr:flavin reductase family protein [Hyphomicrobiaceae bacterium]